MKLCFAKQPYCVEYTWQSTRWPGPRALLDAYVFRTQNISLAVRFKADTWVLDGRNRIEGGWLQTLEDLVPDDVDALYDTHTATPAEDVPWGEYDVVITTDPVVPETIVRAYPKTLWCYYECAHNSQSAGRSRGAPQGGYDLYLDHYMRAGPTEIVKLPQAIQFPYTANASALRGLVECPTGRTGILLDSKVAEGPLRESGLPVVRSKKIDMRFFHRTIARRETTAPADWLRLMVQCKYYALVRGPHIIGQAAIEAAAMGLIVFGDGTYPRMLCHPSCMIVTGTGVDVAGRIRRVEGDPVLQHEILEYQTEKLAALFWNGPVAILEQALEMKRR